MRGESLWRYALIFARRLRSPSSPYAPGRGFTYVPAAVGRPTGQEAASHPKLPERFCNACLASSWTHKTEKWAA